MIIINAYKNGSRSAGRLKKALAIDYGAKTFIRQGPPKNPRSLIVNWGNSDWSYDPPRIDRVVNEPGLLKTMTNKLRFFQKVGHDKSVPQWTTDPAEARAWGCKLLARQILEGSGGAGIVIWDPEMENAGITFPKAPLYVKYENKTHEYRVHVARGLFGGNFYPLLIQRKIFQKTAETPQPKSWEIRNHTNGFVYVQNSGVPTPENVPALAVDFMTKNFPGLHFAALDVIFNEKKNRPLILEGNTAPGLEGQTVDVYAEYLFTLATEAA